MNVKELVNLVSDAAKGIDTLEKGAIGYNGYGFVFRNFSDSTVPFIKFGGSKFCTFNFHRELGRKWDQKSLKEELMNDIYLAGCLKTLVPTLKFGGDEVLFHCWMFVRTPSGKTFPGSFYYRQSGMALGGWGANDDYSYKEDFPEEFNRIVNFNPFHFTHEELDALVEALESSLRKLPVSDFYGVYSHDLGQTLMAVKFKTPFSRKIYRPMSDEEVKSFYYYSNV